MEGQILKMKNGQELERIDMWKRHAELFSAVIEEKTNEVTVSESAVNYCTIAIRTPVG